ncbi:hypothetical protein Q7P37_005420 [Cladosporium fusiforme]
MAPPEALPLFINGRKYVTEKSYEVHSPATGELLYRFSAASVADAEAAVQPSSEALKTWRNTTPSDRRDILLRAAEAMDKSSEKLIDVMVAETGSTRSWAVHNVEAGVDKLKSAAGLVQTLEGSFPLLNDSRSSAIVTQEPYGVILAIAPWRYALGVRAVAFPLAAGNTVVFKGTELAPQTMAEIVSVFHQAGLPDVVLNILVHQPSDGPEITKALISHQSVRKHLKPIVQELGGKAPAIVWEDANLDLAAELCTDGAFLNAGQICMSTERILVHENIKNQFAKAFAAAVAARFPDSDEALTLINAAAVEKKTRHLFQTQYKKVASYWLETQTQKRATLRNFALLCTEEEALEIANDTEYGLTSSVFTEDLRRGLRLARQIDAGAVHINGSSVHNEPALPHGGSKASGYCRFNTTTGLNEWTKSQRASSLDVLVSSIADVIAQEHAARTLENVKPDSIAYCADACPRQGSAKAGRIRFTVAEGLDSNRIDMLDGRGDIDQAVPQVIRRGIYAAEGEISSLSSS